MEPRVDLITLGVDDLVSARRFYVDGLGWRPALDLEEIVFIQVGHGLLLGLWPATDLDADVGAGPPSAGTAPMTLSHNVGSPAEVEAVIARARTAGATVLKEPQQADFGGFHAVFADPSGFRWEVAHNPGWRVDADGTVTIGPVDS